MQSPDELRRMYLKLLKRSIRGSLYKKPAEAPLSERELAQAEEALTRVREKYSALTLGGPAAEGLHGIPQAEEVFYSLKNSTPELVAHWLRANSPPNCHTLVNDVGLSNVEYCVTQVLEDNIPGDLIECGVWRGGLVIFMRGLLKAHGDKTRLVWVADSFEGLPEPDPTLSPIDAISHEVLRLIQAFSVSMDAVKENFRRYGLLDTQVRFIPGWFKESLAGAPIKALSVLRLDGDYYESTQPVLEQLYPKVSPGGFVIIDDYGLYTMGARRAVNEYREAHNVSEPMVRVNEQVVYWRKKR